jgi:DNA repair protein RadC
MYEWKKYETKIVRGDAATGEMIQITNPESCFPLFQQHAKEVEQESFWVLNLNHQNQCIGIQELYRGTVGGSPIRIAEILRLAVITQSCSIIVVHNHPSEMTEPSSEDVSLTEELYKACSLMEIELLDHLIVTGDNVTSLRKKLQHTNEPIWVNEEENLVQEIREIFA